MANQEIHKAIEIIDRQIHRLTQARQILIEAFGGTKDESTLPLPFVESSIKSEVKKLATKRVRTAPTRKDMVANLLKERGPLSRKEIMESVDMPHGSISFVLSDKDTFELKGEKWHLVEGS